MMKRRHWNDRPGRTRFTERLGICCVEAAPMLDADDVSCDFHDMRRRRTSRLEYGQQIPENETGLVIEEIVRLLRLAFWFDRKLTGNMNESTRSGRLTVVTQRLRGVTR
ncbi:hypothetical protein BOSEA31B_20523 [Hyphomicrobiales bacterium]|nr:hypothetical protein BOSEA31B_20523 [Hyphomicrobiales bacterium]CAH1702986.1 hypothetical protein BOSEA1005_30858 [Hyphomicrobiales bacterium]CAI0347171.1 hypothetical protein BO1005MUT1_540007 [Hyphomicrobiales bacterium]